MENTNLLFSYRPKKSNQLISPHNTKKELLKKTFLNYLIITTQKNSFFLISIPFFTTITLKTIKKIKTIH